MFLCLDCLYLGTRLSRRAEETWRSDRPTDELRRSMKRTTHLFFLSQQRPAERFLSVGLWGALWGGAGGPGGTVRRAAVASAETGPRLY